MRAGGRGGHESLAMQYIPASHRGPPGAQFGPGGGRPGSGAGHGGGVMWGGHSGGHGQHGQHGQHGHGDRPKPGGHQGRR